MGSKKLLLICTFLLYMILARTGTANALGESTIYVDPPTKTVNTPGENFNVTVKVTNGPFMTQYATNLTWNPAVIELQTGTESDVVKGTFLNGEMFLVTIGTTPGRIAEITEAKLAGVASGSGTLFTVKFRSKAVGVTPININFAVFLNGLDVADEPTRNNATVTVLPEFPATLLLSFFLTATAIAFIAKTMLSRKRRDIKIP